MTAPKGNQFHDKAHDHIHAIASADVRSILRGRTLCAETTLITCQGFESNVRLEVGYKGHLYVSVNGHDKQIRADVELAVSDYHETQKKILGIS